MKILFYMRAVRQLRPYKSIFQEFSKQGHSVLVVLDPKERDRVSTDTLTLFKQDTPGFEYTFGFRRNDLWKKIVFPARELRTYRRYLLHQEQALFYRNRWKLFLPRLIQKSIEQFPTLVNTVIKTQLFDWCMRGIEYITPPVQKVLNQIRTYAPDVIMVAYRNMPSAALDAEYLKAGKKLGIPTIIPVLSWDTFTTKGLIQLTPDRVLVWNEEQVAEITGHHKLPAKITRIVGAYQFDNWLSYKTPTVSKEAFCAQHGLRAEDPILLYFGFSYGIKDKRISGGHGPVVVEKLRSALDQSPDPKLKKVQIIVRPHPMHTHQFASLQIPSVAVIPKTNSLMNQKQDFDLLYDSLHHSIGAIAINTTAIIDASIQMKPGIVLHWEEYRSVQGGTHFKNFMDTGAVAISNTPKDFAEIVSNLLKNIDPIRPGREAYFKKYIRPRDSVKRAAEFVVAETKALLDEYQK